MSVNHWRADALIYFVQYIGVLNPREKRKESERKSPIEKAPAERKREPVERAGEVCKRERERQEQ